MSKNDDLVRRLTEENDRLRSELEAERDRRGSAEKALRLFLTYNDADASDVSSMIAYADALEAARAHFQSQEASDVR